MSRDKRELNLYYLSKITDNDSDLLKFCREMQLIPRGVKCPTCSQIMHDPYILQCTKTHTEELRYVCNKKRCKESYRQNTVSIRKFTWFENSQLSIQKSLFVTYCFVHKLNVKDTIRETSMEFIESDKIDSIVGDNRQLIHTSTATVISYNKLCRDICLSIVMDESSHSIGVEGLTVEIDESKFGKRKNNKGRVIDGQWIFGGICRETKEMFLVSVEKRDKNTLLPIIKERIKQGTTIVSDGWAAYKTLNSEGYSHQVVNHSKNVVDPTTGAHTQNIENLWCQIKRQLPDTYSRHNTMYLHLAEYMW